MPSNWFRYLEAEFAGADPAVLFTVAGVTAVHVGVRLSDLNYKLQRMLRGNNVVTT